MILSVVLTTAVGTSLAALYSGGSPGLLTASAVLLNALLARMFYVAWCREQRRLTRWSDPLETPR